MLFEAFQQFPVGNGQLAERVSFQLPFEPMAVFERDKLTATIEGQFIDYWEKVR